MCQAILVAATLGCWLYVCVLQGFYDTSMARNVSLELWFRIGVKQVTFLELWLEMTSFELWLGVADEHEELLSSGSGWQVLPV